MFNKKKLKKTNRIEDTQSNKDIDISLFTNIKENIDHLREAFGNSPDFVVREFSTGKDETKCAIIYIDGMTDKALIDENILKRLMVDFPVTPQTKNTSSKNLYNCIRESIISLSEIDDAEKFNSVINGILLGKATLFIDGTPKSLILGVQKWEHRAIEEPTSEPTVRGSKEGFTENLKLNIMLLRRRLKTPLFRIEQINIGKLTNTTVAIAFINGLAKEEIVEEVRARLSKIDIDGILDSGYLEEFISDSPNSPFTTISHTERPDKVTGQLLCGKVAILCDNSPSALTVPAVFNEFLQATEDYYEKYIISSFVRILRYFSMLLSFTLPAIWVALTTFHHELIPTPLLLSILNSRQGVPFSTLVEVLLMETAFEVLREASIRLPRNVGGAITIVGGLVIGQATVNAGIVSAPVVIIVALTGIASYAVSGYSLSFTLRLLRFPVILLAGFLGFYGVLLGYIFINVHLVSLKSFGVPFMSPLAPLSIKDLKDTFIRVAWPSMVERFTYIGKKNPIRQKVNAKDKI